MVPLQLFVPLVVLLLSDAAPSEIEVTCAYNDANFCRHMKQAYQLTKLVEGNLTDAKFKDDKERVSGLKRTILTVLNTKEKSALLEPLRRALEQAMTAFFQFKVSCSGKRTKQPCKDGLIDLFIVISDLGKAIILIYTGNQIGAMKRADEVFFEQLLNGGNGVDLAYPFANIILKALELDQK